MKQETRSAWNEKVLNMNNEQNTLFFSRPDRDTWAMARLHRSLLLEIQNSPLWEKEDIADIPLTEEQMMSLVKGYDPDFDCRYAPYMLGGWIYIARSGYWLKKFRYKKGKDGYYHIAEHYTTEKEKERNLLRELLGEGYFQPQIIDKRLKDLFHKQLIAEETAENRKRLLKVCKYYKPGEPDPEDSFLEKQNGPGFWRIAEKSVIDLYAGSLQSFCEWYDKAKAKGDVSGVLADEGIEYDSRVLMYMIELWKGKWFTYGSPDLNDY